MINLACAQYAIGLIIIPVLLGETKECRWKSAFDNYCLGYSFGRYCIIYPILNIYI